MVELMVAIAEWVTYGPQPEKTRRNSASVGLKVNRGGQVSAADSGLNAVMTIHSTGRKNAIPTTQATTPQPIVLDISRNLCGPGIRVRAGTALALMTIPPRTGRHSRTCAARRWPRCWSG